MVRYQGMVIRPPSEADSLILQVTLGCSHNKCTFCGTYADKTFRSRPLEEVFEDIESVKPYAGHVTRVFLADGDAMVVSQSHLLEVLDKLNESFPNLQRVGIYANARDIIKRPPSQLEELRKRGLGIAYLGLESGSDEVLKEVNKGATARELVEAVRAAQAAGIKMSVIALLGLGGRELSEEHARKTAWALNEMQPRFASFLTLMLVPGTPLERRHARGEFDILEPVEFLKELRTIVRDLRLEKTIFRTNHASNFLSLGGTLPKDKARILAELDRGIRGEVPLRPEFFRGL